VEGNGRVWLAGGHWLSAVRLAGLTHVALHQRESSAQRRLPVGSRLCPAPWRFSGRIFPTMLDRLTRSDAGHLQRAVAELSVRADEGSAVRFVVCPIECPAK
jgi:hypothetical protein